RAGFGGFEVPFELLYAARMSGFRRHKASTKRRAAKVQATVERRYAGLCSTACKRGVCKGGAKQSVAHDFSFAGCFATRAFPVEDRFADARHLPTHSTLPRDSFRTSRAALESAQSISRARPPLAFCNRRSQLRRCGIRDRRVRCARNPPPIFVPETNCDTQTQGKLLGGRDRCGARAAG